MTLLLGVVVEGCVTSLFLGSGAEGSALTGAGLGSGLEEEEEVSVPSLSLSFSLFLRCLFQGGVSWENRDMLHMIVMQCYVMGMDRAQGFQHLAAGLYVCPIVLVHRHQPQSSPIALVISPLGNKAPLS